MPRHGDLVGQKVLSNRFSLIDDPTCLDTRSRFSAISWACPANRSRSLPTGVPVIHLVAQDDADEFGTAPTGHTVMHKSLVLAGGDAG